MTKIIQSMNYFKLKNKFIIDCAKVFLVTSMEKHGVLLAFQVKHSFLMDRSKIMI